jgi:galactokinase
VGIFTLFESVLDLILPGTDKALWSQAAEHGERLRIRSGIMDQFVSANAIEGHALKLNCGSLEFTPVPIDGKRIALLIIHSTVARELVISAYNQRRLECESALEELNKASGRSEPYLVGYSPDELEHWGTDLSADLFKRARHVVTEQDRVERFVEALTMGRFDQIGGVLTASHRSLKEDYEVSCRELDQIHEISNGLSGVYGCRMTGAGFGGCAIALVDPAKSAELAQIISSEFEKRMGQRPWTLISPAQAGARVIALGV